MKEKALTAKQYCLEYFGTSLTSTGHHFFILRGNDMRQALFLFKQKISRLGFNPEDLPKKCKNSGDFEFYQLGSYSVLAILGSCADKRPGSKSVFFVYGYLTKEEMIDLIKNTPSAMQIINKMPFKVDFNDEARTKDSV